MTEQMPTAKVSPRILELDGIRGLAAFAVLLCHLPIGFWFGETGVDLFFVLSGYLITGIILQNCAKERFFATFYWRRSLRIFPIYYIAILAVVGLNALRRSPESVRDVGYFVLYLQNLTEYWGGSETTLPSFGHSWTLAIEEQFYLIWPLIVVVAGRRRLPLCCALFLIAPVILRHFGLSRTVLLGHTDGLAWGGLLACLPDLTASKGLVFRRTVFVGVAVVGLGTYFAAASLAVDQTGKQFLASNAPIVLISIAYAGLVGAVCASRGAALLAPLRFAPVVFLGQISYGLYLYHWIIYEVLDTVFKFGMRLGDPWWLGVVKIALSFGVAITSWYLIELPLMRFKDRFNYGRSPPPLLDEPIPQEVLV